jgi:hypothetical protein
MRTAACAIFLFALLACGSERSDETITAEISQQLANSPVLGGTQLDVTSRGGVVTLSGVVSNQEQRARAESLAWGVEGVESVESRIEISSSAPPAVAAPPPAAPEPPGELDPEPGP